MDDAALVNLIKNKQDLLATLLVKKDSYWRHRAKMHWLQERGINTHLFHQMAYVQRKINTIEKLQDKDDWEINDQQCICQVVHNNLSNLFNSSNGTNQEVVDVIHPSVMEENNLMLVAPFTKEKFHKACFQMHPDKSLRSMGWTWLFTEDSRNYEVMVSRMLVVLG